MCNLPADFEPSPLIEKAVLSHRKSRSFSPTNPHSPTSCVIREICVNKKKATIREKIIAKAFGSLRYFSYLCNVILELQ